MEPAGAGPSIPRLGYYGCPEDQCARAWTGRPGHRDVPTCHIKGDPLAYRSV
ncbi:hypothetical protein [Nocardiopsis valliformis]|uniref:hypothetical protein n=1 Tax=Nocardiopsis valliformis TaxID=239974 RepID=UPI000346A86E|nr:hypothetical protein [Nocardiopsis valliformis]